MKAEQLLINEPNLSAAAHMMLDARLARHAESTVRVFTWNPPAISLGYKQQPPAWLEVANGRSGGFDVVERPTGGGMAFHGSDVSISVVAPRRPGVSPQALVGAVCESAVRLCRTYGLEATAQLELAHTPRVLYCLTQPSPYAVFLAGRKVAGFALRRFEHSWLVQGSLLVRPLAAALAEALPQDVRDQLAARAVALSEVSGKWMDEVDVAHDWTQAWGHAM